MFINSEQGVCAAVHLIGPSCPASDAGPTGRFASGIFFFYIFWSLGRGGRRKRAEECVEGCYGIVETMKKTVLENRYCVYDMCLACLCLCVETQQWFLFVFDSLGSLCKSPVQMMEQGVSTKDKKSTLSLFQDEVVKVFIVRVCTLV